MNLEGGGGILYKLNGDSLQFRLDPGIAGSPNRNIYDWQDIHDWMGPM